MKSKQYAWVTWVYTVVAEHYIFEMIIEIKGDSARPVLLLKGNTNSYKNQGVLRLRVYQTGALWRLSMLEEL